MRRVSGESRLRRRTLTGAAGAAGAALRSALAVAVAISDAIEGFDLREFLIDRLELLAQPLDVAVDSAVVDIDVLAIGAVHELIAALHVAGAKGERLQDQE